MNKKLAFATLGIGLLIVNTIFELVPNSLITAIILLWYLLFCGLTELESSDVKRSNLFLKRQIRHLKDQLDLKENEIDFLRKKLEKEQKFNNKISDALRNKKASNL